jgi:hypothetical protein
MLCAAVSWLAWRQGGAVLLCVSLVVWGMALAKPLLELASDLRQALRASVWRKHEGRYFAFRGTPVQVIEDDEQHRWVRMADVRRIVGFTSGETALSLTYPEDWRVLGSPPEPHLRDEALLLHLQKEASPIALKFSRWIEREVAYPARQLRMRRTRSVVE